MEGGLGMTINLHELANMPGYGKAQSELRKAGLWKEYPMERLERSLDELSGAIIVAQDFMQQAEYDYRKVKESTE